MTMIKWNDIMLD